MAIAVNLRTGDGIATAGGAFLLPATIRFTARVEDVDTGEAYPGAVGVRFYIEFDLLHDLRAPTVVPGIPTGTPGEWTAAVYVDAGSSLRVQALVTDPDIQTDLQEIRLVQGIIPARSSLTVFVTASGEIIASDEMRYMSAARETELPVAGALLGTDMVRIVRDGVLGPDSMQATGETILGSAAAAGGAAAKPFAERAENAADAAEGSEVIATDAADLARTSEIDAKKWRDQAEDLTTEAEGSVIARTSYTPEDQTAVVARPIIAKMREVGLSVTDYASLAAGQDWTAAIQSSIDECPAGGTILVPARAQGFGVRRLFMDGTNGNKSNIGLAGEGWQSLIYKLDQSDLASQDEARANVIEMTLRHGHSLRRLRVQGNLGRGGKRPRYTANWRASFAYSVGTLVSATSTGAVSTQRGPTDRTFLVVAAHTSDATNILSDVTAGNVVEVTDQPYNWLTGEGYLNSYYTDETFRWLWGVYAGGETEALRDIVCEEVDASGAMYGGFCMGSGPLLAGLVKQGTLGAKLINCNSHDNSAIALAGGRMRGLELRGGRWSGATGVTIQIDSGSHDAVVEPGYVDGVAGQNAILVYECDNVRVQATGKGGFSLLTFSSARRCRGVIAAFDTSVGGGMANCVGCSIEGTVNGSTSHGISITDGSGNSVPYCSVTSPGGHGVYVANSTRPVLGQIQVENAGGDGVRLQGVVGAALGRFSGWNHGLSGGANAAAVGLYGSSDCNIGPVYTGEGKSGSAKRQQFGLYEDAASASNAISDVFAKFVIQAAISRAGSSQIGVSQDTPARRISMTGRAVRLPLRTATEGLTGAAGGEFGHNTESGRLEHYSQGAMHVMARSSGDTFTGPVKYTTTSGLGSDLAGATGGGAVYDQASRNGVVRWRWGMTAADGWFLDRHDASGAFVASAIQVAVADGAITLSGPLSVTGAGAFTGALSSAVSVIAPRVILAPGGTRAAEMLSDASNYWALNRFDPANGTYLSTPLRMPVGDSTLVFEKDPLVGTSRLLTQAMSRTLLAPPVVQPPGMFGRVVRGDAFFREGAAGGTNLALTKTGAAETAAGAGIPVQTSSSIAFRFDVVSRGAGSGNAHVWRVEGVARRGSGGPETAVIDGTPVVTYVGPSTAPSGYVVGVTINATTGELMPVVTWPSGTVRWVASGDYIENR